MDFLKIFHGTTSEADDLTFFNMNLLMVPLVQKIYTKI